MNRPLGGIWDIPEIRSARILAGAIGACLGVATGRGSKGLDIGSLPPRSRPFA